MGKLILLLNKFLSKFNIFRKRVDYIGGNDALPPPLKKDEEEQLVGKLASGDEEVRNTLIAEVSFYEPLNIDWDGNELLLSDILGTENDTVYNLIEDEVDKQLLFLALKNLNEREKEIVKLRFGLSGNTEKTQKEVADMLGISQSYISRLEKKIINRLKKEINKMI